MLSLKIIVDRFWIRDLSQTASLCWAVGANPLRNGSAPKIIINWPITDPKVLVSKVNVRFTMGQNWLQAVSQKGTAKAGAKSVHPDWLEPPSSKRSGHEYLAHWDLRACWHSAYIGWPNMTKILKILKNIEGTRSNYDFRIGTSATSSAPSIHSRQLDDVKTWCDSDHVDPWWSMVIHVIFNWLV